MNDTADRAENADHANTADRAEVTPAEIRDRYSRLATAFTQTLDAVPDDRWQASTPCEGWTVADAAAHVVDTERDFLARFPDQFGELPAATGQVREDWAAVRGAALAGIAEDAVLTHSFDGYFGPTSIGETVDTFYSMDLLVHRWDVARGAGLGDHEAIGEDDADHYLASSRALGAPLRTEGICGPEVEAPDDATPGERLLAFLGRRPR